jgi:hypothetical protein
MASVIQYRYYGLSTEDKPLVAPDGSSALTVGSLFEEADTGTVYYWAGAAWVPRPAVAAGAAAAGGVTSTSSRVDLLILRELRRISHLLALSLGVSAATFDAVPEPDGT